MCVHTDIIRGQINIAYFRWHEITLLADFLAVLLISVEDIYVILPEASVGTIQFVAGSAVTFCTMSDHANRCHKVFFGLYICYIFIFDKVCLTNALLVRAMDSQRVCQFTLPMARIVT